MHNLFLADIVDLSNPRNGLLYVPGAALNPPPLLLRMAFLHTCCNSNLWDPPPVLAVVVQNDFFLVYRGTRRGFGDLRVWKLLSEPL